MSLIPIEGVLETVAKAEQVDSDSTKLLCEMALFDVLTEMCDLARPQYERDLEEFVAKRSVEARRVLVREYMERRLDGEDIEDVIKAASEMTLLEDISKADNPNTPWWDARDMSGRFASAGEKGTKALKTNDRKGYVDPIRAERYGALRDTGRALSEIGGPSGTALGGMATAAGTLGPEAERVLGRGLKRVAYRYRGTERTADRNVVGQVKNARALIDAEIAARGGDEAAEQRLATLYQGFTRTKSQTFDRERRVQPGQEPFMAVARHWGGKAGRKFTEDQARLAVQGDIAAEYLRTKLPTPAQTAISMAAGRTPPSVGIMIDRDGDVVSEAQGFNGDHFLPFDLKNLKRLQGGQYVRTRAMGGPTVEDVYTGLLTGARQMQVVSNSGVFTLEFDPTIRGGRRYSDKATQMIRRYEALLGTIGSGQLMQQDVDPERQRELRQEAITEARGNTKRATEIYTDLLEEERGRQSFAFQDDEDLEAQAVAEAREELGGNAGRSQIADLAQDKFKFLRQEAKAKRVKAFQLDADGYAAAMRSLQEEFPFYIRAVRTETLPEFVRSRGLGDPESTDVPVHSNARDKGAIERGEVNIEATSAYGRDKGLGRGLDAFKARGEGAPREESTSENGEGTTGGAGASGSALRPTSRQSQMPKMDNWLVKPVDWAKNTHKLAEAADLTKPEIQRDATIALNNIQARGPALFRSVNGDIMGGSETDETIAVNAASPLDFAMWLAANGGVRKLQGMGPANKAKALEQLEKLDGGITNQTVELGEGERQAKEEMAKIVKPLAALAAAANPFGPAWKTGEAQNYSTTETKPMAFPEIIELGDKVANYDHYKAGAKHQRDVPVNEYLDKDIATIKSSILELQKTFRTLKDDGPRHPKADVERKMQREVEAAEKGKAGPLTQELMAAHLAWAYQHARSLASNLPQPDKATSAPTGGADAAPFGFSPAPKEEEASKRDRVQYSPDRLRALFQGTRLESAVSKALEDRARS